MKEENLCKKLFRRADPITVERGGRAYSSRGVITAREQELLSEQPVPAGVLSAPVFLYLGDFLELRQGDILHSGGRRYRVLSARVIRGFGNIFCMRAAAERIPEEREEEKV